VGTRYALVLCEIGNNNTVFAGGSHMPIKIFTLCLF